MAGSSESFSNRALWQFITGSGILRPKELITLELTKAKTKILNGLLTYHKQKTPSGEQLKKDKNITGLQLDFTQKLSKFLDLDEVESYSLFCSFLVNEFRGSKKNLQQLLSQDRHVQGLILKIRDYYYTERLYGLRCLHHIFNYWPVAEHPYRESYAEFLDSLLENKLLFTKLLEQFDSVCQEQLPTYETHGLLMTESQALIWANHNLKEQCEILELLLMYFKDFEADTDIFISLINKFKAHGFGWRQNYKHIVDEKGERLIYRIGYLEVLVLLEALDIDNAVRCQQDESFADHTTLKDQVSYDKLSEVFKDLGNQKEHGPLVLSWAMMSHLFTDDDTASHVLKSFGNKALQLGVFDYINDLLKSEPFNGKTIIASISHCVIYTLLYSVLSAFHETTLGSTEVLYDLVGKVMKYDFIAEEVLQKDLNEGVGSLYQSAMAWFPFEFDRFLHLNICLASASTISAKKVKLRLQRLTYYTEYLDNNQAHDLLPTEQTSVFRLSNDKKPYEPYGDLKLGKGCVGQYISSTARKGNYPPIIQWQTSYNGWQLLMCEIKQLLYQVSQGSGNVSAMQINRVTMVMTLVKEIMNSDPDSVEEFSDIIGLSFDVLHRFSTLNPPPLDLLSNTMECLRCSAFKHPKPVWHSMKQTGFLPYLTENLDNMGEILSGRGLHAGLYGTILARSECTEARYPLTQAVLVFITNLIEPLTRSNQEEELVPTILYILREVFPVFRKWRFSQTSSREELGQKCLDLFHKILNFLHLQKKAEKKGIQLQEVCVYSLLFTEAGRALLEIIAIGVDNIEIALSQQGSATEGDGIEEIELIQIAFSVLNRLLLLKPPDLPISPVEQALSSQPAGRQHQHVVATIAQYIYHRHNPKLPTLALVLLKRLAMVSPMSILACLGTEAEPVRDMFLTRLSALSEDLRLKVVILEFLSVCIEYQPGLIEIFLNVQTPDSTDIKKDVTLGKSSCLQTVLNLMDSQKQGNYLCPPDLLCACTDFIQSLWDGLRERAMEVLRAKESFWPSIFCPLEQSFEISEETGQYDVHEMKTVAYCLKVLAQEVYVMSSSKLDKKFKNCCQNLAKENKLLKISQFVRESLIIEGKKKTVVLDELNENPALILLLSWKNFLITVSKFKVDELSFNDKLKEEILDDILLSIESQFQDELTVLNMKLASISSALYFTLIKNNISCISKSKVSAVSLKLQELVLMTVANSQMLIPSVQIGILSSLTVILQAPDITIPADNLSALLPTVCAVLLQSSRQLPALKELLEKQTTVGDETASGSGEKTDSENGLDVKLKLQIVCCCLLEELIRSISDSTIWLTVLQQNSILQTLLTSVETYIKAQKGLSYVHSAFLLLLTIAETEKGASVLMLNDLAVHTCLVITKCYSQDDKNSHHFQTKYSSLKNKKLNSINWCGVYGLCCQLYSTVLSSLRYSFLEDCFNFLGAHQERLQQSLEKGCINLHDQSLQEAEVTCSFIYQLSFFSREWRFNLPDILMKLLTSMVYMTQTFISLLIRPRYLSHLLEAQRGSEGHDKIKHNLHSSPLLQQQTSTEDIDHPSKQLLYIQQRMLDIIGCSLAGLKQFTPDLCEVLLDQSMDISEYEPILGLGFSTPSIDQEAPPTFGMLISCITSCFRLLSKIDPKGGGSPHKSPDTETVQLISKNHVVYVMDNSLYLIMSQACRYLKDPELSTREKQFLKRELGAELNSFLSSMLRYMRRGAGPVSPVSSTASSPQSAHTLNRSISQTTFSNSPEQKYLQLVQEFVKKFLR